MQTKTVTRICINVGAKSSDVRRIRRLYRAAISLVTGDNAAPLAKRVKFKSYAARLARKNRNV